MTKLEQVADAIVKAQQEVGSTSEDLARAAVEALRALDMHERGTPADFLDAILSEKPAS